MLLLFVLLLTAPACFAQDKTELFLLGFAEVLCAYFFPDIFFCLLLFFQGLESDFAKNATELKKCIRDEQLFLNDLEEGFKDIYEGVERLSMRDLEKGLKRLGAAFNALADGLKACNFAKIGAAIERIAKDLSEGVSGWVKLLLEELLEVWEHRKGLARDIHEASKAWKEGKYFNAGLYSGRFFGTFLQVK